ncbi:hypothetical protein D0868_03658 [Hortaea werneckii]|nr:hypothetical protein D0868_03658 [Hortaea werneckii]
MSKSFTTNDVKEHGSVEKGLYIIIDNGVYEMGGFVDERMFRPRKVGKHHMDSANSQADPGGAKILKRVGGKDASKQFWKYHNESVLKKYQERLKIGEVKEQAKM